MRKILPVDTFQTKAGTYMDWYPSLIVKFRVNFLWVRWRRAFLFLQQAETVGRARSTDRRDRKVCENFGRRDLVCGGAGRRLGAHGRRLGAPGRRLGAPGRRLGAHDRRLGSFPNFP